MQNCGRASFNASYDHVEMRQPGTFRGPANREFSLSVDAPEFVPTPRAHPQYGVDISGNVGAHVHQQAFPHQFQQQHHVQQQHHHQQQQQQQQHHQHHHHHMNQHNHMNQNHGQNQRRNNNNPRFSVQDRIQYAGGGHPHQHPQHPQHRGPPMGGPSPYQYEQSQAVEESRPNRSTEAEMHALNFLVEVMRKLNADPGMYETYQKELNSIYLEFAQNEYVISNAIEILFVQSINEQNFRYMGARICRLLDAIDVSPTSVFRQLLCLKMNDNKEENFQFMTNEAHKVRGTTLFLAELYMQLQNDGSRITDIAKSIYQTIHLLLKKITPENIKCVCQTLKLCGYELELDFPRESSDIINILRQVKKVDVSTERLLNSVLELSTNRWGRNESISTMATPTNESSIQQEFSNEPVFYGPDGQILTEEESSFLSGVTYPAENFDDYEDNDPDELVEPDPEMDLEIQMAFKDFVKGTHQK